MHRIRLVVATLVAVAMMSFGAAACTPEQQAQTPRAIEDLITWILASIIWTHAGQQCTTPGCPPLG